MGAETINRTGNGKEHQMGTKYSSFDYDIVGYVYQSELLCPECTVDAVRGAVAERSNGGVMPPMDWEWVEDYLDRVSGWFVRDRYDETTYDDDEFPKIVESDATKFGFDHCEQCGEKL